MAWTAASHQGVINMFWPYFRGVLMLSILKNANGPIDDKTAQPLYGLTDDILFKINDSTCLKLDLNY